MKEATMRKLNAIKRRIPQQMYKTILGQIKAGDVKGAEVGIGRVKKKIEKEEQHEQAEKKTACGSL